MKKNPRHDSQRLGPELSAGSWECASILSTRRKFLQSTVFGGAAVGAIVRWPLVAIAASNHENPAASPVPDVPSFELDESTIGELQDAMKSGKYTARGIVEKYLARIEQIDKRGPAVNSAIASASGLISITLLTAGP